MEEGEGEGLRDAADGEGEGRDGGEEIVWCDDGDDYLVGEEDAADAEEADNQRGPGGADVVRVDGGEGADA